MTDAHRPSRRRFLARSAGAALAALAADRAQAADPLPHAVPFDLGLPPGAQDAAYWARVRELFVLHPGLIYMNAGSLGPLPRPVLQARQRMAQEWARDPTDTGMHEARETLRRQAAAFVGARPEEIAFTRSTTEGMNLLAHGLDWRAGDEVVMATHEHPGGYGAYRTLETRRGIRIRWVELPLPGDDAGEIVARYRDAFSARTRLLVVSHITFVTGLVLPLPELIALAHDQGALVSVDGAHALGMLPLDLNALGCDHYAAAGHKWLLAGTGTGLCYLRRALHEQVWPLMGQADAGGAPGARRYEQYGQADLPSLLALGPALALHEAMGRDTVAERIGALSGRLRARLAPLPGVRLWTSRVPARAAGLTSFSVEGVPGQALARAIRRHEGIHVLAMAMGELDAVRVSTHVYNTPEDVDRLVDAVRAIADNPFDYV